MAASDGEADDDRRRKQPRPKPGRIVLNRGLVGYTRERGALASALTISSDRAESEPVRGSGTIDQNSECGGLSVLGGGRSIKVAQ
jgi:hypothetical protein